MDWYIYTWKSQFRVWEYPLPAFRNVFKLSWSLLVCILMSLPSNVVLYEAVDWCIWFIRKIPHGGDRARSRPQGLKNVHNLLMTVWPLSWACGHGTGMLLILKKLFSTWLLSDIFRYDSPKKCSTILYAVNLWLKPVSATGVSLCRAVVAFWWKRFYGIL